MQTGRNQKAVMWLAVLAMYLSSEPVGAQSAAPSAQVPATTPFDAPTSGAQQTQPPAAASEPSTALQPSETTVSSETNVAETATLAHAPAPAPVPEPEAVAPIDGAKVTLEEGLSIESHDGSSKLNLGIRVQPRLVWTAPDDQESAVAFELARARFSVSGHVYSPSVGYKFEADFGKGSVALKDFFVDYSAVKTLLHVRVGQFKKPFNRQQINSSGKLELVERAITDRAFGAGRDIGLMLHNNYDKSPRFEWALGVFNGTGDATRFRGAGTVVTDEDGAPTTEVEVESGKFSNVPGDWRPALVARAGYNHGGIKGYSETDLEGGPLRLGVAASVEVDLDNSDDGVDDRSWTPQVDLLLKAYGLSVSGAVYYFAPAADVETDATGFYAQAGYLIAQLVQPVVRFAVVNPEGAEGYQREMTFGLGYYPWGHGLKWQTDLGLLTSGQDEERATDLLLRSQLQLGF